MSSLNPTPEQIDMLAARLGSMGVKVPGRDTAFFQAIVRQWLEEIGSKPTPERRNEQA